MVVEYSAYLQSWIVKFNEDNRKANADMSSVY